MDYIEIEGYKSIKNTRIDFLPINILIGANGCGKTNFLSFFDFLNQIYKKNINEFINLFGGANKFLHKGQKCTNSIFFNLGFDVKIDGYAAEIKLGTDGFVFKNEIVRYNGIQHRIENGNKEANLPNFDLFNVPFILNNLDRLKKYHFHDTSLNSPFSHLSHIENDIFYLYKDGRNIAAFLYKIQETDKLVYQLIIKNIQSIAPYFSDFYLKPNVEGYIRLIWTDKYSDITYGANDLSDGTLRFIALSVLFLQPHLPDTIIIDEPELGLHPAAIAKLAGMIKSVAAKKCQVILATQSADLISHFAPEDIITVDQINGESVFTRLNSHALQKWLDDYTIDDLWKRNIITSGQPNFE